MALVYDRDDPGLPVYVPRRRRAQLPSAQERVQPLVGSLGAQVTFDRFVAMLRANGSFSAAEVALAANVWSIGFHEGVRAQARQLGRELPPFEEAYGAAGTLPR